MSFRRFLVGESLRNEFLRIFPVFFTSVSHEGCNYNLTIFWQGVGACKNVWGVMLQTGVSLRGSNEGQTTINLEEYCKKNYELFKPFPKNNKLTSCQRTLSREFKKLNSTISCNQRKLTKRQLRLDAPNH